MGEKSNASSVVVGKCDVKDHFEDLDVDGSIILKLIWRKWGARVWTGWIWLRIGTSVGLLWMQWWTFRYHQMQGIPRLAVELLASQGLCSMELGPYYCTDLHQFGHWHISEPLKGTKTINTGQVLSHHIKLICRLSEGVNANSKCCCSNHIVSVSCVELLQLQDQHVTIYTHRNTHINRSTIFPTLFLAISVLHWPWCSLVSDTNISHYP